MTKVTMDMTGGFTVSRGKRDDWTATASIDLDKVPEALWPELAKHGLKQKIADSASQAKTADEATGMMNKAIDAIIAGNWSTRGTGEGLGDVRSIAIHRLYRAALAEADRKRFGKLSTSEQVRHALADAEFSDDIIAAEVATIETERAAKRAAEDARAATVAELKGKIKVSF